MAAMDNAKRYACKYRVDTFVLMNGGENLELDHSNILAIEYLNDYEFNVRSMIKITLRLDVRRKTWILKHKRELRVKFELSKIGMDTESESFVTNPETVWNDEFALYLNDEEESTDTQAMEERISLNEGTQYASNDIQSENYYETQNDIDLYLFDQNLLNASNTDFNGVFTKDIMQNMVAHILTETKHKKVLISKFENDEEYEELIVPNNPAYKALIYLDQFYGFYETGAMIYYDIDTLYVLNTNGKLTAKRPNEASTTCMMVSTLDNSTPGNGMIESNGTTTYVSVNEMDVNPQKPSIPKNETIGSEAKFVVSDDITVDLSSANQSYVNQRNEEVTNVRKDDNKFIASITKARKEENETILYFSGENLDINAFTPNKEFQVVFEEASKNGTYGSFRYRLSYAYHYIKLASDEYMDASHKFVIKKGANQ